MQQIARSVALAFNNLRDAIVARIFGAGMATDAFFVAFKLPNLLRRIFAEGAFSQAFVRHNIFLPTAGLAPAI